MGSVVPPWSVERKVTPSLGSRSTVSPIGPLAFGLSCSTREEKAAGSGG